MTYRKISAFLFFLHICKTFMRNPSKASNLLFLEKKGFFTKHPPPTCGSLCFCVFVPPFLSLFLRESIVSRTHRRLLLRLWGGACPSFSNPIFLLFFTGKRRKGPLPPNGTGKRDRISIRDYLSSPRKIREREVSIRRRLTHKASFG